MVYACVHTCGTGWWGGDSNATCATGRPGGDLLRAVHRNELLKHTLCTYKRPLTQNATNKTKQNKRLPKRSPITEGEREYTRSGNQSQKGRENIPVAGTNHKRGERI
eukprot:1194682-Prorocentrum_minimum.AAC.3